MGKLQSFAIEFASQYGVFNAGQSLIGAVFIVLSETINVRGELHAVAYPYCSWGSFGQGCIDGYTHTRRIPTSPFGKKRRICYSYRAWLLKELTIQATNWVLWIYAKRGIS